MGERWSDEPNLDAVPYVTKDQTIQGCIIPD